ncbi:glycosyltransferase family 4 protein [Spirosoma sp. KNUC1025]|uniref:glycosyltransferase family 4 protein n=1 Tax=Spirosoma sp. KNUC1025 TaxID=2894082 RepID=UPI00386EBC71|nr:glycosyltransferase family 4 protein [Spirosoma sp. KNUC1025]
MVSLYHPMGNANVRAAGVGLAKAELLADFTTAIACFPGDMIDRLSSIRVFSELGRRRFDPYLRPVTQTWPWYEIARLIALRAGFQNLTKHETGPFSVDAVFHNLDKRIATSLKSAVRDGVKAVYAYEDGAEYSFREAKRLGIQCLYDLPIGYWRSARELLEAERELRPAWAPTLTGFRDSESKLARKDEELRLADRIFVASQFTAKTLQRFPGQLAPIEVIPYGFPPIASTREYSNNIGKRPIKLLFVGGLSQRKGIANLFDAVEQLGNHVTLTVVGRKASNECPALDAALTRHNWIPSLPHSEVLKLMQQHDVLVFPSLFEGFGLVITEAMSQGTPVITTDRTVGPDLIKHGQNGWLVEAGSTLNLKETIEEIIDNPAVISEVGTNAMHTARNRPWDVYGLELAAAIKRAIN